VRPFRYCPSDATELETADPEAPRCPRCGRVWYRNMAPTAGAVIVRDGRALVTVRAFEPEKGKVDVPGGFLRLGETPAEGLRREVEEELGLEVDVSDDDYLQAAAHVYGADGDWVLALGFRARAADGEPAPADDVAEVRWVTEDDLTYQEFAWEHDRELVREALRRERGPRSTRTRAEAWP
jgi:ADP-ribose pyrophosphatase YjhB (NUDIX family)